MTFGGGTGLCGGSAISTTWVMTAAHCTAGSSSTQVILGAHQLTTQEASQQRRTVPLANYRNHPQYNPNNLNNDISLLLLPQAVLLNQFVSVSIIPALGRADQFAGAMSTASGWGRIADGSTATSAFLRSVDNPIITNTVCSATYGTSVVFGGVVCTSTTGGRGPCNGDSGGPLTVAEGGSRLQVGIAAFVASAGCEAGFPAGYARVSHFRQWIQTTSGI
jgi:chymotrypsin